MPVTRSFNCDRLHRLPAGAIMLHQILNSNQSSGAGRRVFRKFADEMVKPSGGDLYLSVRRETRSHADFMSGMA